MRGFRKPDPHIYYDVALGWIKKHWYFSIHHQHTQEMRSRPLLLRILWSPSYHVVFNSKCRELLELMTEVLICLRTNVLKDQREKLVRSYWHEMLLIKDLNLFLNPSITESGFILDEAIWSGFTQFAIKFVDFQ